MKAEFKGPAYVTAIERVMYEPDRSTVVLYPETGGRIVLEGVGLPLEAFLRRAGEDWVLLGDGVPATITVETAE